MTTDAPPTSPPRPTLEQQPGKPDVLVRLRRRRVWWVDSQISEADDALSAEMDRTLEDDLRDAIATIEGLRAANLRHCEDERLLKEARVRVAELEAMLRKIVAADDAAIAELEKIGLPPGETTRGITEEARTLLGDKPPTSAMEVAS